MQFLPGLDYTAQKRVFRLTKTVEKAIVNNICLHSTDICRQYKKEIRSVMEFG